MIRIFQVGAGRIGVIHAANIAAHPQAELYGITDINTAAAQALAQKHGGKVMELDQALVDPAVDAVLIASPTDTHADLIIRAAKAGKAIFCEKPVDLDIACVRDSLGVAEQAGVAFLLGFNRRFDPSFAALKDALAQDRIGRLELLSITSRDPSPPPASYIKVSGGIFRDMMIHDFDMAGWLLDEEIVEVFATGSCLVDPAIGDAGDIDTAAVVLKTISGKICQISNSRRASYGYDQRIEAHGEKGMLQAENRTGTSLKISDTAGVTADKPLHFFLERYADAYRLEMQAFIDAVLQKRAPSPGIAEGLRAQLLAEAAWQSWKSGQPVDFRAHAQSARKAA